MVMPIPPRSTIAPARVLWAEPAFLPVRGPRPSVADPATSALTVECLQPHEAARHLPSWADLVGRSLEPNVFLDPGFALPAAQHLGRADRPRFVLVWDGGDRARRLVCVCPVVGGGNPLRALASVWFHDLSTLGFPLLDRDRAVPALEALVGWIGRGLPLARGLVIRSLPSDGPTAAALAEASRATGHALATLAEWRRAALPAGGAGAGLDALSAKGAKEIRRQRRRLAERGQLAYSSARAGDELRTAIERFLALEAAGWKGAAGTALLARPGRTAFARTAMRLLAQDGRCRIDSLTLDGEPVVMGVVLRAGTTDFFWKTAYREDLSRLSPGVQFVLDLTAAQAVERSAALTDSCAVPDHPMIDRLWRDRIALSDVAVAARPGRSRGFEAAVAVERQVRRLRAVAKRALAAWRARRGGTIGSPA